MKTILLALAVAFTLQAGAQQQKPAPTLRSILLDATTQHP